MRRKWALASPLLVAVVALLSSWAIWGQESTGSISGRVLDIQGQPIPGADLVVTSKALQGSRRATSNAEGEFLIPSLPPAGDYRLTVEAQGCGKTARYALQVALGKSTSLTFSIGTDMIDTLGSPAIHLQEAEASASFTREELATLPLPRDYSGVLYLPPSSASSGIAGSPSICGASGVENTFLLDGVGTTDPVTGAFGFHLPTNFVQEIKVGRGGYDAANGPSTGGMFGLLVPGGSNEFHGDVFLYYESDQLAAKSHSTIFSSRNSPSFRRYDQGFDIGGPILKDRLWFFAGYNPVRWTQTSQDILYSHYVWNPSSFPDNPLAHDILFEDRRDDHARTDSWLVNLTYRASDKHNLGFFIASDASRLELGEGPFPSLAGTASRQSLRLQGGDISGLKWFSAWSGRFFQEILLSATHDRQDFLPERHGAEGYGVPLIQNCDYTTPIAVTSGFGRFTRDDRNTRQLQAKWTFLAGTHMIKWGGSLEYADWKQFKEFTGGWYGVGYMLRGGNSADLRNYQYKDIIRYRNPGTNEKRRYLALFAQDQWSITDDLSLSYGARWEQTRIRAGSGNTLELPYLSPRLGLTWDFARNGRSKLYATYGEYAERIPMALSLNMDSGHEMVDTFYRGYGPPTHHVFGAIPTVALPGTKAPFDRESAVGVEYEFLPGLAVGARAVYREIGRLLEDVGYLNDYGYVSYVLMNPGESNAAFQRVINSWLPTSAQLPVVPYAKPIRRYRALEFTANKRLSNCWFLDASYTLSRAEGNTAGAFDSTTGVLLPHATPEYDLPFAYTQKNRNGLLPLDRTHSLKIQGSYRWNFGFVLGAVFQIQSGRPINKIANWPLNPWWYGTEFVAPRGEAGRLPATWTLDLHMEYEWKIASSRLSLFADIFNVNNCQKTTSVYETYYTQRIHFSDTTLNPYWGRETGHQPPRSCRLGLKWSF